MRNKARTRDSSALVQSRLIVEMEGQQQLTCFPKHCTVDGGRIVHIVGAAGPKPWQNIGLWQGAHPCLL